MPEPTRTRRPTEDTKPTEDTEAPRPDRTQEPGDGAGQGGDGRAGADQEGSGEGDADAEAQQSAEPEATPQEATPDEAAGTPAWVWWLLAAIVLAAVAGTIAAVVHARRKHRWREELAATEVDVGWFARELLPDLRRSTSLDQVVGGWHVGSARVEAAEDRLTALEATAPTDEDRTRARTLRDAVRQARQRLDSLTLVAPHDSLGSWTSTKWSLTSRSPWDPPRRHRTTHRSPSSGRGRHLRSPVHGAPDLVEHRLLALADPLGVEPHEAALLGCVG